jgi:four helix bundle protein
VIRFIDVLPKNTSVQVIGKQLLRAGTSVGANYRAACRAKSRADFISKMKVVEEECDEVLYWIELLVELDWDQPHAMIGLKKEAQEILSITVATIKTARAHGE